MIINVTTRDGHARAIEGQGGRSLLENMRAGMIEEVLALTATYAERVTHLANLPDANKQHLLAVVARVRKDLLQV